MAAERVSSPKPSNSSKWFANKSLKLTFSPRLSKSCSNFSPPSSPISPMARSRVDKRKHELKEIFRYFDSDGDGKISASELRTYFASIGEYMSHEEAQGVIDDLDTDGDNLLDFRDFYGLMKRKDGDDDLKMAFEMFEQDKGSGCITPKGLQRMLNRLGDTKSLDECVAMIQVYDTDGNGVLDFEEFNQMMA